MAPILYFYFLALAAAFMATVLRPIANGRPPKTLFGPAAVCSLFALHLLLCACFDSQVVKDLGLGWALNGEFALGVTAWMATLVNTACLRDQGIDTQAADFARAAGYCVFAPVLLVDQVVWTFLRALDPDHQLVEVARRYGHLPRRIANRVLEALFAEETWVKRWQIALEERGELLRARTAVSFSIFIIKSLIITTYSATRRSNLVSFEEIWP